MLDLSFIENEVLDFRFKGFPAAETPLSVKEVAGRGWNVLRGDLPLPLPVLRRSILERNERWMRDFIARFNVSLSPHGKTTMAPQLFDRQLSAGAWGMTLATLHQVGIAVHAGVRRVLIANQVITRADLQRLVGLLNRDESLEILFLVDSLDGVALAEKVAQEEGLLRPFQVLLEIGYKGGRTGCRSRDEALTVARTLAASPHFTLRGIECYEGLLARGNPEEDAGLVSVFLNTARAVAESCDREGLFEGDEILLTAGGSAFFDIVAREFVLEGASRPVRTVLRSGCYVTNDSGVYERLFAAIENRLGPARGDAPGLAPALEVWSVVQSRPQADLALLSMGRRDASADSDLPRPLKWFRPGMDSAPQPAPATWRTSGMNDQHTYLSLPDGAPLKVGDMIGCGISHPCTTFDKWQLIMEVDDSYTVIGAVRTFF